MRKSESTRGYNAFVVVVVVVFVVVVVIVAIYFLFDMLADSN